MLTAALCRLKGNVWCLWMNWTLTKRVNEARMDTPPLLHQKVYRHNHHLLLKSYELWKKIMESAPD